MAELDWMGWFVIATLIIAFLVMGADKAGPDLVFTLLLGIYTAAGILPIATSAAGYANTGLLTVIFLYIVAEGVYQTGGLEGILTTILGRSRSPFVGLVRMMIPTMFLSAFLNNTPIVALMTPIILAWCRRTGVPAKKMLMPLSIASVLGGTCTLIGTSTNLVVSGAQTSRYKTGENATFAIFDIAPYGIPYAIWGFMFVLVTQRWLLPGNSSRFHKDLLLALRVGPASPSKGRSILDSGLRGMQGLTIIGIVSKGQGWVSHPHASYVLQEGDAIYIGGEFDQVEYAGQELGLDLHTLESEAVKSGTIEEQSSITSYNKLVQVTIPKESDVVGLTLAQANFRERFHSGVVGVGRRGHDGDGPFSNHVIKAGDVLVLDCGKDVSIETGTLAEAFTHIHSIKEGLAKEFLLETLITSNALAGKTVSGAGLRGIPGILAVALDPSGSLGDKSQRIQPIPHDEVLQIGDRLWLAVDLEGIKFLSKLPGLQFVQQSRVIKTGHYLNKLERGWWVSNYVARLGPSVAAFFKQYLIDTDLLDESLYTAAVAVNSPLVGKSLAGSSFRSKFNGAVIALHREGARSPLSASDTVLLGGDVLLVASRSAWAEDHKNDANFTLLTMVPNSNPPKKNRAWIAIPLAAAMVITQIIPGIMNKNWDISSYVTTKEWINLWPSAVLTASLMIFSGCMSGDQARQSILWDVYLAIAGAFGVSAAMERTGVANEFAQVFIQIAQKIGGQGAALTSIYIATALLSEILTNNASGAIMYPIAAIAADTLGIPARAASIAIMLGASAGFINPFSYQCNMMVYKAGNYKVLEFVKFGVPFQTYLLFVAGFILCLYNYWQQVWIVSFVVCAAFLAVPLVWSLLPPRRTLAIEEWFESKWASVQPRASRSSSMVPLVRSDSEASIAAEEDGAVKKKPLPVGGGTSASALASPLV